MMDMEYNRKLILEDGEEYYGFAFGYTGDKVLEIVFNTSMVGYQEILSDPSYTDQAVVMTYPLIGNYGMATDDYETKIPTIGALIVREYNDKPSNFRSEKSLAEVMIQHQISGIYGVDTRKLTRSIRNKGSRKCLLTSADTSLDVGLQTLSNTSIPKDAVSRVSCRSIWRSDAKYGRFHVVAIDCGMKMNIVRSLHARDCDVTIVPWNTPAETIEALKPDGVFISNGPGDPTDVQPVIDTVRALRGKYPTVDTHSLEKTPLQCTHINLLDNTVEGMECRADRVFSVQYHPESAPGPQDSAYLFDRFVKLMEEEQSHA